jgi:hypothetical protein
LRHRFDCGRDIPNPTHVRGRSRMVQMDPGDGFRSIARLREMLYDVCWSSSSRNWSVGCRSTTEINISIFLEDPMSFPTVLQHYANSRGSAWSLARVHVIRCFGCKITLTCHINLTFERRPMVHSGASMFAATRRFVRDFG